MLHDCRGTESPRTIGTGPSSFSESCSIAKTEKEASSYKEAMSESGTTKYIEQTYISIFFWLMVKVKLHNLPKSLITGNLGISLLSRIIHLPTHTHTHTHLTDSQRLKKCIFKNKTVNPGTSEYLAKLKTERFYTGILE